eukprot:g4845.t1
MSSRQMKAMLRAGLVGASSGEEDEAPTTSAPRRAGGGFGGFGLSSSEEDTSDEAESNSEDSEDSGGGEAKQLAKFVALAAASSEKAKSMASSKPEGSAEHAASAATAKSPSEPYNEDDFLAEAVARAQREAGSPALVSGPGGLTSNSPAPTGDEWQRKQLLFKIRTETHDPNQIQQHLQEHPFHAEALLQMSKIYAMTQQYDASAMLLRRCLFVLEHAWHKGFLRDIQEGCARMDYDDVSSENACFFEAMYAHAQMIRRRGCRRSALEVMKCLLALDQRDPMGVLLVYDRFAIGAGELDHFLALCEKPPKDLGPLAKLPRTLFDDEGLLILPNFAYSYALALFRAQAHRQEDGKMDNSTNRASRMLVKAVMRYPLVASELVDRTVCDKTIFSKLMGLADANHITEGGKGKAGRSTIEKMIKSYIENVKEDLWKATDTQQWLVSAITVAVAEIDQGTTTSQLEALLVPRLLQLEAFSCYAQLDMSKGRGEVAYLPGEDLAGAGGGGAGGLVGSDDTANAEGNVDLDENAMLLMMQLLMPWNQVPDVTEE